MATEVLMPRQGQSVESCIIIEWKVNEGDVVEEKQPLCEVETDKATFEVEATAAGTVLGIFYPADADVEVLKVIAAIGEPGEDISDLRPEMSEDSEPSKEESEQKSEDSDQTLNQEESKTASPSSVASHPSFGPTGKASPR